MANNNNNSTDERPDRGAHKEWTSCRRHRFIRAANNTIEKMFPPGRGAQWVGASSIHPKVVGSIPSRGTHRRQSIDVSLSHQHLSLSLNKISSGEGFFKIVTIKRR